MMSESKLLKSIAIGAITGAIISMFDRKTREHTIETTKKVKERIEYYAKNRDELQQMIEQKVEEAQKLYENASGNINSIVNRMDGIKEISESVQMKEPKQELNKLEHLNEEWIEGEWAVVEGRAEVTK